MPINIPDVLDRLCYRYPSPLVDAVTEHEPGRRIVAVKNVTVNEEFFQGHFPGAPLMPGVLMIETLAQVATILLTQASPDGAARARAYLRGVDNAKFRLQVVPGDRLRLEVTLGPRRSRLARAHARGVHRRRRSWPKPSSLMGAAARRRARRRARCDRRSERRSFTRTPTIGAGTVVGPHAVIGEHVRIGRDCRIGASSVVDGPTEIGDGNEIFPFASIGLIPQDLKFTASRRGSSIGDRNVFREFVTIHRGTAGGGGVTEIGDHNVFMAYAHIAHDCHVGNHTIFGNAATLGGHVTVEDYATISAFSGVHQFCRVGKHAFIGGFSVITKDALPFAKTVGNRARIYGLNTIGLVRRKFSSDSITKLRRAYRYLLHSNTSRALAQIERDPSLDMRRSAVRRRLHPDVEPRGRDCAGQAGGSRKRSRRSRLSDARSQLSSLAPDDRLSRSSLATELTELTAELRMHDRDGEVGRRRQLRRRRRPARRGSPPTVTVPEIAAVCARVVVRDHDLAGRPGPGADAQADADRGIRRKRRQRRGDRAAGGRGKRVDVPRHSTFRVPVNGGSVIVAGVVGWSGSSEWSAYRRCRRPPRPSRAHRAAAIPGIKRRMPSPSKILQTSLAAAGVPPSAP